MLPTRVLLVDDHQLVRQGIRFLLEQDEGIEVIGEASDAEEAIAKIEELAPEIILLDISLPGMNGIQVARLIRSRFAGVRILVLTMHSDEEYMRGMLMAGADGYLVKHSSADELLQAIRLVCNNRMLYPRMAGSLVNELQADLPNANRQVGALTGREKEILSLVALGETSREIARKLFLSAKTIDNYRARILSKLQARNAAEAVTFAMQQGLISSPEMDVLSLQSDVLQ